MELTTLLVAAVLVTAPVATLSALSAPGWLSGPLGQWALIGNVVALIVSPIVLATPALASAWLTPLASATTIVAAIGASRSLGGLTSAR